jgi:hypothetical protein
MLKSSTSFLPFLLLAAGPTFASTGDRISLEAAPWNVSLRSPDYQHGCSAALIDARWILTAGHCLDWLDSKTPVATQMSVWGGSDKISELKGLPAIRAVYLAPGYVNQTRDVKIFKLKIGEVRTQKNDLGLIELETPVDFTQFPRLKPGKLTKKIPVAGDSLFFSGWGTIPGGAILQDKTPDGVANKLRGFTIPYEGDSQVVVALTAATGYGQELSRLGDQPELIAVFDKNTPCRGDSGSSIILKSAGENAIVAIVEGGDEACSSAQKNESTNVRVAPYLDWIAAQMGAAN